MFCCAPSSRHLPLPSAPTRARQSPRRTREAQRRHPLHAAGFQRAPPSSAHQPAPPCSRTPDAEPRQRTPLVPLSSDSAERSLLHPSFLRDRNTAQSLPAQGGCTFASSAGAFPSRGDSPGYSIFCTKRAQGSSAHKRQHVTSECSEIPPGPRQSAAGGRVDKMLLPTAPHCTRFDRRLGTTRISSPLRRRCVRARHNHLAAVFAEDVRASPSLENRGCRGAFFVVAG